MNKKKGFKIKTFYVPLFVYKIKSSIDFIPGDEKFSSMCSEFRFVGDDLFLYNYIYEPK